MVQILRLAPTKGGFSMLPREVKKSEQRNKIGYSIISFADLSQVVLFV